jgi:hypothetical protein
MNTDYVKKGLIPNFEQHLKKQHPYWDAFVQYKLSEDSEERTRRNKENASKKQHFHHFGQGGHSAVIPKWRKMEEDLIARGIELSTSLCEQNITSMLMEAH